MGKVSQGPPDLSRSTILSEAEGLSFLKNGEVPYVTEQWVTTQCELFLLLSLIFFLQPLLVLAAHYSPILQGMHGG